MSKQNKLYAQPGPLFWITLLLPMLITVVLILLVGGWNPYIDIALGSLIAVSILWIFLRTYFKIRSIYKQNEQSMHLLYMLDHMSIPIVFFDANGHVVLQNTAYQGLQLNQEQQLLLRNASPDEHRLEMTFGDLMYDVYIEKSFQIALTLAIFQPKTVSREATQIAMRLPVITYMQIDNFDELVESSSANRTVLQNAFSYVEQFVINAGGVIRSYDRGKLFTVLDHETLQKLCNEKFPLLQEVRQYKLSNGSAVTLSIAAGEEDTLVKSAQAAQDALTLTLGRGGDQAVVRTQGKYLFYGGKPNNGEQYSRVKSRVFANSLSTLMAQYDTVMIMGHKMADMDALGSALGMACIARAMKKNVYVVLEQVNPMIESFMKSFSASPEGTDLFLNPVQAEKLCSRHTLLIVVDTQRNVATADPELLKTCGATVVLDHHVRGIDHNIEPTLSFTEPHASSTSELVCEILQYIHPEVMVSSLTASGLLCGIIVDTKNFSKNATARTFEAAAFLRRHDANASFVRQVFMETKEEYLGRAEIVNKAYNVTDDIVIAVCPLDVTNAGLLSAKAADDLINIKGIEAAFVLFQIKSDVINVSARSSEDVNVQLILEGLGGGGHFDASGAVLQMSMDEAQESIKQAILTYKE